MEAAVLLPTLGFIVALLTQPACLAYTRALMLEAAGEGVRVLSCAAPDERETLVESYVMRRLAAVPEITAFHVGGEQDWEIESSVSDDGRWAEVCIKGHAQPLPLVGTALMALGPHDEKGAVLEVQVYERIRPDWLEGSFDEWMQQWE